MAPSTSRRMIRPLGPLPCSVRRSTSWSRASRRTNGETTESDPARPVREPPASTATADRPAPANRVSAVWLSVVWAPVLWALAGWVPGSVPWWPGRRVTSGRGIGMTVLRPTPLSALTGRRRRGRRRSGSVLTPYPTRMLPGPSGPSADGWSFRPRARPGPSGPAVPSGLLVPVGPVVLVGPVVPSGAGVAMVIRGAPTRTPVPAGPAREVTTPAYGQGTSTTALAVSTSATGWSMVMTSPTWTNQRTTSADTRPSPRSGRGNSRTAGTGYCSH